jgi:RNA polymerase primary sigma factor
MSASVKKSAKSVRKAARRSSARAATVRRTRSSEEEAPEAPEEASAAAADAEENLADDDEAGDFDDDAPVERPDEEFDPDDDEASSARRIVSRRDRARNENAAPDDKHSFLAMYFREMSELDVLRPEEEFQAARHIEGLEIRIWEELLAYAPAVDYVLKLVESCMDNSLAEFRTLRRAAGVSRRSPTRANQTKLERASTRAAAAIRALDTDRQYLDAVMADLDRVKRQVPGRIVARLPFQVRSRAFRDYLGRVNAADRTAAMARNDFVKANLRLVVSIARRFNHGRMALADLIQEGNIGLMKAVERYDYRRGFRFSTYASWWIRHAISRALADKGREVRLPVHMIDAYHRISKAKRELGVKLGRQPSADELELATDIPAGKIEKMRTYLVDQSFSLDRPVNEDDGRHFIEFLQDPEFEEGHPADRLSMQAMSREVRDLLRDLKPIEADILRQRFGLADDRELTLKEIGEKYNLSRERIRQLQEQALGKMRRALARKEML